ncbi:tRNA 2-thiouridine(34) synthase MnmA [Thermophagus sp. OGC60D27]|uniref:tRNA 2-thiouridine(34) synthase MnmA n=1 Tax=Thermophagus sp. OGC60D27 TaxID=3458415 RepID=UPI0040378AEC
MRVLLGMSGGLDSTMSALLLKEAGHQVIGVTLRTWHRQPAAIERDIKKAGDMARQVGIEHHVLDIQDLFREVVVDYFCREYLIGRTPNPCNRCNPRIKWPALLNLAKELGCHNIATGHYVQKHFRNNKWYIKKGVDPSKDQSYFLWNLNQEVLSQALFPLGRMTKSEVRELALKKGFHNMARQNESMGVCFLDGANYREFISEQLGPSSLKPGDIVTEEGEVVGRHNGIAHFTIGQKKGLGLPDKAFFVISLEAETNRVVVSKSASLETGQVILSDYYLTEPLQKDEQRSAAIRIRGIDAVPPIPGIFKEQDDERLLVTFKNPAWGITPGQSVVFYQDDLVIGGGIV